MIKAKDLILRDIAKIDAEAKISEAFSMMLKLGEDSLAVFSGDSFLGLVSLREFLRRHRFYSEAKVKSFVESRVPFLLEEDSLSRIAEQMYHSGQKILPVMRLNKIVGFVHVRDVLSHALKDKNIANIKLNNICSKIVIAQKEDSIAKVLSIMRKIDVKQVPIVDNNNEYCGLVTLDGLIEKYFIHATKNGLFSLYGRRPESKRILDIKVRELLEETKTFHPLDNLINVKDELIANSVVLLVDGQNITGVVTVNDVLKVLMHEEEPSYRIQISDMPKLSKLDEEKARAKIKSIYEKIKRILHDDVMLSIHFKSQKKTGLRAKHFVKAKVTSGSFKFNASSESWNLFTALENVLSILSKEALKNSKRRCRKGYIK
ncbi:MAG: CBS domain-containing protein [Candidatus Diapherotrites archaeon]|nr:CBS domain-containing protein [Candidatus Diapherotrites archaeon]